MILENTRTAQLAEILPMYTVQNHFAPHIRTQKYTFPEHVNWSILGNKDGFYLQHSHKKFNKTFSQISLPLNIISTAQYRKEYKISQTVYVPSN